MPSTVLGFGHSERADNSSALKGQIGVGSNQGNSK